MSTTSEIERMPGEPAAGAASTPGSARRVDAAHDPGDEAVAAGRVVDADRVAAPSARGQRRAVGRVAEAQRRGDRGLAGDPAHRQAVAAVGGDGDVEHLVAEPEQLERVRAERSQSGGSTRMPSWSSPSPSSRAEQIMPSETWP